ncbi:bifunctional ornithine acetyltransferase/N-acetylglutamate synthase [Chromatiales bacterium (ex Bugula neritina AB1)]|nr:bifunctional ornithine acetyltransferase/N-acetylglutamate synthase [Chromatiales bacterium (ex Bugula neritina AB1)]
MAVGLSAPGKLSPVKGVRLATTACGIKKNSVADLLLIALDAGASVAGVFTRNAYCAAPVQVARRHLDSDTPRALLINSGNANAGTGRVGEQDAINLCKDTGLALGVGGSQVLPFSTGVIGETLPVSLMQQGIAKVAEELSEDNWLTAAHAIMTTDTAPKAISREVLIDGKTVTLTGIAKGSGMIHPDMATMLAFVATDAAVDKSALQAAISEIAMRTFNSITVDGDTSTNDACICIATGQAGNKQLDPAHDDWLQFTGALEEVSRFLAHAIIRDGEGATRFIEIAVAGGASIDDCRQAGFTVAHSPLVKTAFFAGDPNLGRILAAVGRSKISGLEMQKVSMSLGDMPVVKSGEASPDYNEARAAAIMAKEEVSLTIDLAMGSAFATVWTTDLSYDYVKINAEYRS